MAEVGRQDLLAEAIQVSDDERESIFAPRDDSFVLGHLRVAVDQIIKLRGEPAWTTASRRLRRRCRRGAEKLKRTGAVLSRQIASRRCCVRAARALLLGHRAGVAFWSVCCSVLRVWGRAQSVPARRAQFFAAVLRSLRQSCHKLVVAIGARYRRALAPAFGAALSSGLARRLVGRAADNSAGRRLRTSSAMLRAARLAEEAKNAASGLSARPMTQTDAYRAGRGLMVRLARWRSLSRRRFA